MTAPVALLSLALGVAVESGDGLVQQTQPPPVFTVIEGIVPPTDFTTLISGTPVIVAGTVEQLLPAHVDNGLVVQHVLVRVDETIKDRSHRAGPGEVIAVRQYGGRLSVDGRDYITEDSVQRLSVGDEAILLLGPARDGTTFDIVKGLLGLYRVADKSAESVAVAHFAGRMPEFAGRTRIDKRELILLLKRADSPN